MRKGEIWWAKLPKPRGSEPAYDRPVLVLQSDRFNKSAINTVICAVCTKNTHRVGIPGNVKIPKQYMPNNTSVVNLSQIFTIDKQFFENQISALPKKIMDQVENELKLVLDLE